MLNTPSNTPFTKVTTFIKKAFCEFINVDYRQANSNPGEQDQNAYDAINKEAVLCERLEFIVEELHKEAVKLIELNEKGQGNTA